MTQGNFDQFTFFPAAKVETVGSEYITEENENDNTASVSLKSAMTTIISARLRIIDRPNVNIPSVKERFNRGHQ